MYRTLFSLVFLALCLWIPHVWSYWLMAASPYYDCLSDVLYILFNIWKLLAPTFILVGFYNLYFVPEEDKSDYWYPISSISPYDKFPAETHTDYLFSDNSFLMTLFPDEDLPSDSTSHIQSSLNMDLEGHKSHVAFWGMQGSQDQWDEAMTPW
ncbi:hypothetical protein IW262DRAFT_1301987 [Armillaria fumosa]|nr:hypothetical protein IW262DRAFT_1301987 [Armillaria fumosa]